jgi:Tfp pilus assembly protein FimV
MAVLTFFIITVGTLPAVGDPVPSCPSASTTVRVSFSDTLWSIAAAHRLPGFSTAQMVRLIADANGLTTGGLDEGTVLRVPAEAIPDTSYAEAAALQSSD